MKASCKMKTKTMMAAALCGCMLTGYGRERVIPASDMIAIPGKDYRMQRTEVTQMQWEKVMGDNPSYFKGPDRPVENVSWDDCQKFIKRVSALDGVPYRLPTAAEWEYACRAGSTGDWGKRKNGEEGPLDVMGWYEDNSGGTTHPVAQKEPNAWGLYDMHGNVWEWCADQDEWGGPYRVTRGGSWNDRAGRCAADSRYVCYDASDRVENYRNDGLILYLCHSDLGFRLVSPMD